VTTPKLPEPRSVLAATSRSDCYAQPHLGGEGKRPRRYTMRRLNLLIASLAALIIPLGGLMAAAGPAMASSASSILRECEDNGAITGHFSRAELQSALSDLSGEVSEYSDCQDLIQQALVRASSQGGGTSNTGSAKAHVAGATGKNGGGGSGKGPQGSAGTTGSSKTNNGQSVGKGSSNAVNLAGSSVRPGSSGSTDASSSSLPVALIIVLILLALTALSGGAVALRRRVDAGHST
jgi:cobalamin biosynthesis Mg chelatase CobN